MKINKAILADQLYKGWVLLPHCRRERKRHLEDTRSRFDYAHQSDISIFATNCVGGELYHLLGIQFRSPLINTSMDRGDFMDLCASMKDYLACPLRVERNEQGSCTGTLGSDTLRPLTIFFPHDSEPDTVIANWKKRVGRVNYDKLVLICDDRSLTDGAFEKYDSIPAYRKVLFTYDDKSSRYSWCHQLPGYEDQHEVGNYNGKSLNGLWNFETIWDYVSFLNG